VTEKRNAIVIEISAIALLSYGSK